MLNDILNRKNLGATTARSSYTGRSGTSSTSSTNTSSTNTSTTSDPYAQYITYQSNNPVVIISDGTYSFTVPLKRQGYDETLTVPEALDIFLRRTSTYGDFVADAKKEQRPFWKGKPRAYADSPKARADYELYFRELKNKAISSGDAITIADVLKSVKNKIFYVRRGYVYIAGSLDPAPHATPDDAAKATKHLDDKGTGGDGGNDDNIITVGNDEEDSDIWWLLLPVVVGGAYLLTRKGNKKKKRK